MKQLKGAKREEMLQDAANKGFDDVTVEILKSKTIFTQNLLLKGDTVEFEDFDIQLIKQGKEFKTVNKDGEEITVRGLMILCCINGVWRWFPLSTFQRGCQIAPEGRTEYMEAIREKHDLNLRILTCGDALEVAQLLAGKRLKVTENQSFKFQRFNKDREKLEGEFDLKPVSLFEELA